LQRRIEEAEVTVCFVLHRVADYDAWRRAYDRVPDVQRERGVTGQAVYRAEGDPNNVLVMQEFRSSQEAHSFVENPQFREVMQYAGVDVGSLRLEFYDPA
jgi:heme-degrading monooxygenase HmoA